MATVDAMMSPANLTVAAKVTASAALSEPVAKKAKKAKKSGDPTAAADRKRAAFCAQIRAAPGWFTTMQGGTWKNVTNMERSKRTLFVLQTPDGGDQFCTVGKIFRSRLSREELMAPLPYDTSDEHTELSLSLGLRPCGTNEFWTDYDSDISDVSSCFQGLRTKAIDEAFAPLLADKPDKMPGMPDSRLKRGFGKTKKEIATSLDSVWGGTGMNGECDIANFKRKAYSTSIDDLAQPDAAAKWMHVVDERGDRVNFVEQPQSVRTGDTVLVWYRVLAQACAGNFHVSLEPRQVMRLGRGADGSTGGSAGLAAALAAAMDDESEDDDV